MRKILFEIKQGLIFLIRAFYYLIEDGNACVICNKRTFVIPVCKNCITRHFNVSKCLTIPRCDICGKQLTSNDKICSACKEKRVLQSTSRVIPLFSYRLWNKELLYLWKIKEERSLSSLFAYFFNNVLNELNISIIIPVPPRKGKISKNGWDQIDEICQFLQKRYGRTILKILERKSVLQQKKLNRAERLETIKNAYCLIEKTKIEKELKKTKGVIPSTAVLIDDVCTTGSTIECCAEILKKAGVENVIVITLFNVD